MIIPSQHIVMIISDRPPLKVSGMLADESTPDIEGGRGGWNPVTRMRRSALVEWAGPDAESYELPLRLIDGATANVDAARRDLERMARMPSEGVAPPIVRIEGLVPAAGKRWAINNVEYSDTIRDAAGAYTSCIATISLVIAENTGDGVVVGSRVPSVVKAIKGDTLTKLAVRYYGAARHASTLGRAQTPVIRDIRKAITPGRKIKLP